MKELAIAIFIFFRQGARLLSESKMLFLGGNVDPFYLFAPAYCIQYCKDEKKVNRFLLITIIILTYGLLQIIFLPTVSITKLIVNIAKILVCILALLYAYDNWEKISIYKIVKYATLLFGVAALLSVTIFKESSIIWRFNDIVNVYAPTRLMLSFLEPSELGYHLVLLIIILVGYFISQEDRYIKYEVMILIIINALVLYLARPMGSIVIGAGAVAFMLLCDMFLHPTRNKKILYMTLAGIAIVVVVYLFVTNSPIAARVIATINGDDSSNSYRLGLSLEVLQRSLGDFHLLGCGFGNINTGYFIGKYSILGLQTVIVNSFIYFLIETGLFGFLALGFLLFILIRACIKSKSAMKWGLLSFLVIYQFVGSHFTSGLNWALYGLILSPFCENLIQEKFLQK